MGRATTAGGDAAAGRRRPRRPGDRPAGRIGTKRQSDPDERRTGRVGPRPHGQRRRAAGRPRGRVGRARRGAPRGARLRRRARPSSPTTARRSRPPCATAPRRHALVVTTGGTGLTPRDVTPQATTRRPRLRGPRAGRGDARRRPRDHAAGRPVARRRRRRRADAGRQPAGQPEGRPRVARGDRAGPGPRPRDARRAVRSRVRTPGEADRRRCSSRSPTSRPIPLVFLVFWGAAVFFVPRDGPPPAGVPAVARRRPEPVRRTSRRRFVGLDPVRVRPDQDVQGRPGRA